MTTKSIEVKRIVSGSTGSLVLVDDVEVAADSSHTSVDDVKVDLAEVILLTMDNGASTDMEIRVFTSPTKTGAFDTVPFTSFKVGANERMTRPLVAGYYKMKVVAVNADAVNASDVTVSVKPTWG